MSRLKSLVICGMLLGLGALIPSQLKAELSEGVTVEKTAVYYQQERPFSWYYPYRFQFYTPHRTAGTQCFWVYTNGAYVYTCR